jgi:hypothetical protein
VSGRLSPPRASILRFQYHLRTPPTPLPRLCRLKAESVIAVRCSRARGSTIVPSVMFKTRFSCTEGAIAESIGVI